jgi:hypothetical protein
MASPNKFCSFDSRCCNDSGYQLQTSDAVFETM